MIWVMIKQPIHNGYVKVSKYLIKLMKFKKYHYFYKWLKLEFVYNVYN